MKFKSLEEQIAEQEQYPKEIKVEMDRSFLILRGLCWQAFIIETGDKFIRVVDLNDLTRCLWLKVRIIPEDGVVTRNSFHFDYECDNLEFDVLKYKYLYLTERNHRTMTNMFIGAFSTDEYEQNFYKENIHFLWELVASDKREE